MFSFSLPSTLPSITISEFSCADPPEVQCLDLEDDTNDSGPSLFKFAAAKGEDASNEPVAAEEEGVMTPPPVVAPVPHAPTKAKRGKNVIISDTQVRRSERVHSQNKGFKNDLCKDRSCVGCSVDPPTLSVSVVRDLGSSFCKLDPASLTEEALNDRLAKKAAVERPKKAKKSTEGGAKGKKALGNNEDAGPSKSRK
jgi:hypothetical protein